MSNRLAFKLLSIQVICTHPDLSINVVQIRCKIILMCIINCLQLLSRNIELIYIIPTGHEGFKLAKFSRAPSEALLSKVVMDTECFGSE